MNEIVRELKCVIVRNGIEIWAEAEKLEQLQGLLMGGRKGYIEIEGQLVRSDDVVGIFTAQAMEESGRRKNGQWKCKYSKWHDKFVKCMCKQSDLEGEDLAKFSRGF